MENLFGPYGFTLALTCVCVVFAVLFLLQLCYTLVGRFFVLKDARTRLTRRAKRLREIGELPPVREIHDSESGIITINRNPRPYGEIPMPVVLPLNVKLGQATAHTDEFISGNTSSMANTKLAYGTVVSPLPGVITNIFVSEGSRVTAGKKICTLEAMKMENIIEAERSGIVKAIYVKEGDSILEGAKIVMIS